MTLRVGSIGYATWQGLGVLLKAFYDRKVITDVAVIHHGRWEDHPEWFPGCVQVANLRDRKQTARVLEMASRCHVMLFWETPFLWEVIPYCRERGVKTVLAVMYECEPERLPYQPDLILCPSLLDKQYYPSGTYLPVPVEVPWRLRTRAEVFCHNAGHSGLKGRNGTKELVEALPLIKSPIKLILRSQVPLPWPVDDPRVDVRVGTFPHETLYNEADCCVWPDKFNGLSLPLQEAFASGLACLASDRYPANTWLPREPLIPVARTERGRAWGPGPEIDVSIVEPRDIAARIDAWYGQEIAGYSERGRQWGEAHSWQALGPKYREVLEGLLA